MTAKDGTSRGGAYVYRLYDLAGTVYIGKGTGRRLEAQKRKYSLCGEIICECKSEIEAYAKERELIAKYKPIMNRHPGGNGSWAGIFVPKWVREIEAIGVRRYAAQELLKFDLRGWMNAEQIRVLRQIALPSLVLRG